MVLRVYNHTHTLILLFNEITLEPKSNSPPYSVLCKNTHPKENWDVEKVKQTSKQQQQQKKTKQKKI